MFPYRTAAVGVEVLTPITSFNQFVATAVAEKLAAMSTATFFAERRERADFEAFDRLMPRRGGEPPKPDDLIR